MKENKICKFFSYAIGSVMGIGYCPVASGTAGSLVTLPLAFVATYYYGFWGIICFSVVVFVIGVWACKEILKYTKHDPSLIVIDEVVGQLLTFGLVAETLIANSDVYWVYLLGFVLFRIFDITKPQPAKWADTKLLNAWGVMLDDVFAGVYAAICLYLIYIFVNIL